MTDLIFSAMPTEYAQSMRDGALDAYGLPAERAVSNGGGNPCRHCLSDIPAGKEMLIFAYRPFSALQPYAETGPVFLCADPCERYGETAVLPDMFARREMMLMRGYGSDERIRYGTGKVTPTADIAGRAQALFEDPAIQFIDLRSASNNCFQCRIERP